MKIMVLLGILVVPSLVFASEQDDRKHLLGLTAQKNGDCRMAVDIFLSESPEAQKSAQWLASIADAFECIGDLRQAIQAREEFHKAYQAEEGRSPPAQSLERLANLQYQLIKKRNAEVQQRHEEQSREEIEAAVAQQKAHQVAKEKADDEKESARRAEDQRKWDAARPWRLAKDLFLYNILHGDISILAKNPLNSFGMKGSLKLYWIEVGLAGIDEHRSSTTDFGMPIPRTGTHTVKAWSFLLYPLSFGTWFNTEYLYQGRRTSEWEASLVEPYVGIRRGTLTTATDESTGGRAEKYSSWVIGDRFWFSYMHVLRFSLAVEYEFYAPRILNGVNILIGVGMGIDR